MPRIKARVLGTKIDENGRLLCTIQCDEKLPKKGEIVNVKWGSTRTPLQNNLYWLYLSWLINHGGLKEHGHFDPTALHENFKAHFLAEKVLEKGELKPIEEATTTDLMKSEFGTYMMQIDLFVQEFFGVSTQAFWEEHEAHKF